MSLSITRTFLKALLLLDAESSNVICMSRKLPFTACLRPCMLHNMSIVKRRHGKQNAISISHHSFQI